MIDAHAHLDDPRFADDLDAVIARATAAGVERVLSCGGDQASSERTVTMTRRNSAVLAAVGVHPHHAESWTDATALMLELLARDVRVVAIGEIGLDLSGRSAPLPAQEAAFSAQLELARRIGLPVVVHVRNAGERARALVDRLTGVRGMVHCFSEGPAEVDEWLRRGFTLSIAGTVTYPKSEALREAARLVPADRLLLETDAPYLAPQGRRGQRNEPSFVMDTLAAVAALRREAPAVLGRQLARNAKSLFGIRWS